MSYSVFKNINLSSDLSIRLGNFTSVNAKNLYAYSRAMDNNERTLADGLISSEQLAFVTTSSSFSIASTNGADTQIIEIEYYLDTTSEVTATQSVTLTGQTEASISTNMFRIISFKNTSSTNPLGTIYIGLTSDTFTAGKPTVIHGIMVGEAGMSHMGILYCPPNKKLYFVSFFFQSDMNSGADIFLIKLKIRTNAQPNAIFIRYLPFSNGLSASERLFTNPMLGLQTLEVTAERTTGAGSHDIILQVSYFLADIVPV